MLRTALLTTILSGVWRRNPLMLKVERLIFWTQYSTIATKIRTVGVFCLPKIYSNRSVGLRTVRLTGTAVNLHFESHNGNGRVKNGRKRVWRPFCPPFDVIHFFHIFSAPGKCKKNYWARIRKICTFKQQIASSRCEQTFRGVSIAMSQHH